MADCEECFEPWEVGAPAHLQYWPPQVHPGGPGDLKTYPTLRDAVAAAATETCVPHVAFIMTSGGHMLKPADIDSLWQYWQSQSGGHCA